ncbi:MAG: HD domain-containing protein [Roseburia sp.]|nr:HD domain-containing protein [Roseburia sp.]
MTRDRITILNSLGIKAVYICTHESELKGYDVSIESARRISGDIAFADSYTSLLIERNSLEYMHDDSVLTRHNKNVANLTAMCVDSNHISIEYRRSMVRGAALHDIGKMGIPDKILNKNGRLTDEEYDYIKLHPVLGVGYLLHRKEKFSDVELKIAEQHHENYDGSGYPYGLKGSDIDKSAALIHVIDVFEARCAKRTYKKPEDRTVIIKDIEKDVGKMFDPDAFHIFQKAVPLYFVGERVIADDDYIYIVVGHTSSLEPILHNVVEDRECLLTEVANKHKCFVEDLHIKGNNTYEILTDVV